MSTPADAAPRFGLHQPWRQLALALAAGLLGLIANAGAPMLGSGLPMRLDVVIVLCVAITAGPAWAALSATIATALVCWHAGHPTLMFVAVLEAVAIGSLVRRRVGIALASAGFWITAGVPILYGWSAGILQADSGEATAGALQQALNGVAQAVLVQILARVAAGAHLAAAGRTTSRRRCGRQVFDSVIPLAVCPVIVLGLVLGRVVASGEEQDTRRELVERAAIIGSRRRRIPPRPRARRDIAGAARRRRAGERRRGRADAGVGAGRLRRLRQDRDARWQRRCARRRERPERRHRPALRGARLVGDEGVLHRADEDRGRAIARTSSSATASTAPCRSSCSARRS